MKNVLFKLKNVKREAIGFDDEFIVLSSRYFHTFEELRDTIQQSSVGVNLTIIPFDSVLAIEMDISKKFFTIHYLSENEVEFTDNITLSQQSIKRDFVTALADELGFELIERKESWVLPTLSRLLGIGFIIILTLIARALIINSKHIHPLSPAIIDNEVFNKIAAAFNPDFVTLIGSFFIIYLLVQVLKKITKPSHEYIYRK